MSIDDLTRQLSPRNAKPRQKGCFLQKRTKTTVVQPEIMYSKVSSSGWILKEYRLLQFTAIIEYVMGKGEVSMKPATVEKKDVQSTIPILLW